MFRIFAEGEGAHRLEGPDGTVIGWVRGRAIGVRGFVDERRAVAAAAPAWRALDAVLRRQFAGWPRHEPALDALRVARDGADEWITDGQRALARLHRLGVAGGEVSAFAIEFELPSFASEGIAIAAARLVAEAVQDHAHWTWNDDSAPQHARPAERNGVPGNGARMDGASA